MKAKDLRRITARAIQKQQPLTGNSQADRIIRRALRDAREAAELGESSVVVMDVLLAPVNQSVVFNVFPRVNNGEIPQIVFNYFLAMGFSVSFVPKHDSPRLDMIVYW